ncbi:MAG: T9SS type A sorting domain-containing protein [Saprospiraceae bacterium]
MFLEFKVNSVSTKDQLLDEETFNFDQNPTNDVLKVNINFADYVDHATLVIHDVNGAIIDVRNMYNEKESVQNIKVGTLPAGEYIATLFTNDKLLSKKFVVTK